MCAWGLRGYVKIGDAKPWPSPKASCPLATLGFAHWLFHLDPGLFLPWGTQIWLSYSRTWFFDIPSMNLQFNSGYQAPCGLFYPHNLFLICPLHSSLYTNIPSTHCIPDTAEEPGTEQQTREQHLGNHLVFPSRASQLGSRMPEEVSAHCLPSFSSLFFVWALPQFYSCRKFLQLAWLCQLLFLLLPSLHGAFPFNATVLSGSHDAFLPFQLFTQQTFCQLEISHPPRVSLHFTILL